MTIIIDTLSFCHYPGFFGYILGLFQYLPTGLILGIFFWSLARRDAFFFSLAIVMKIVWWGGLIFKYFIIPYMIPSSVVLIPTTCDSYVPTFLNYFSSLFFGGDSNDMIQGSEFPNIDVLQTGSYMGFVLLHYIFWWKYPLKWTPCIGLILLTFVPWSFLSAGNGSVWAIVASIYFGILFGGLGLFISYYIHDNCIYGKKSRSEKTNAFNKKCFEFWCGGGEESSSSSSGEGEEEENHKKGHFF